MLESPYYTTVNMKQDQTVSTPWIGISLVAIIVVEAKPSATLGPDTILFSIQSSGILEEIRNVGLIAIPRDKRQSQFLWG